MLHGSGRGQQALILLQNPVFSLVDELQSVAVRPAEREVGPRAKWARGKGFY